MGCLVGVRSVGDERYREFFEQGLAKWRGGCQDQLLHEVLPESEWNISLSDRTDGSEPGYGN